MYHGQHITGVSAVNAGGAIVLFVEAGTPQFDELRIDQNDVQLVAAAEGVMHVKTYGPATIEALKRAGVATVQRLSFDGRDMGNYVVEVARGL